MLAGRHSHVVGKPQNRIAGRAFQKKAVLSVPGFLSADLFIHVSGALYIYINQACRRDAFPVIRVL